MVAVPSTAHERVKRKVENILERIPGPTGQKLRIIERPGPSLRLSMVKNDPCPKPYCGRSTCPIGQDRECKNNCYRENVDYTIVCRRCYGMNSGVPPRAYIGETSRPIVTRVSKHLADLKGTIKKPTKNLSWMACHVVEDHDRVYNEGNPVNDWIVTIDGIHRKPLNRQVKESINIKKVKAGVPIKVGERKMTVSKNIFNSKEEYFSHTNEWDGVM